MDSRRIGDRLLRTPDPELRRRAPVGPRDRPLLLRGRSLPRLQRQAREVDRHRDRLGRRGSRMRLAHRILQKGKTGIHQRQRRPHRDRSAIRQGVGLLRGAGGRHARRQDRIRRCAERDRTPVPLRLLVPQRLADRLPVPRRILHDDRRTGRMRTDRPPRRLGRRTALRLHLGSAPRRLPHRQGGRREGSCSRATAIAAWSISRGTSCSAS